MGDAPEQRCASLPAGQLEVLRLVNQHLSSKEIGHRLGISSHTVDQRARAALRRLGVSRRSEAARLVAAYDRRLQTADAESPSEYQRLIHQPPHIDVESDAIQTNEAVSFQIRHADRTGGFGPGRLETEQSAAGARTFLLPWSTPQQPGNRMRVGQRLAAIVGIAMLASFSAGMFLAGLESLARMVQP